MKPSKKIFKKIRGKYNKKPSISKLAEEYYGDAYCERWRRKLFREEMERQFGHHLSLKKRIERLGHGKCKPLSPAMLKTIENRLGEPSR